MGSCSSPGDLNLISTLRQVILNFRKDLDVSSKIIKGRCCVVSKSKIYLLEEATCKYGYYRLTDGT